MFPEKERHWLTGPFTSFYYDSWSQWLENAPYTKAQWSSYRFLYWNIKDSADSRKQGDTHTVQLVYGTLDGLFSMKTAHVIVGLKDELAIVQWLHEHTKL